MASGQRIKLHYIRKIALSPNAQPALAIFHAVPHKRIAVAPTRLPNSTFALRPGVGA